jgi:hypothetical protein
MLDQLRHRMTTYLTAYRSGILTVAPPAHAASLPVRYQNQALIVTCWVARWSDIVYLLEERPMVELLIPAAPDPDVWMHYQARAHLLPRAVRAPVHDTHRPAAHYVVAQLMPYRIDLIDQRVVWGARETLEL